METFEILLNDRESSSNATGYEVSESDPVIDTELPDRMEISRGYNPDSFVRIPVDYRAKAGRNIRLEWRKDGQLIKQGYSTRSSGRSSIKIHRYHQAIVGNYSLRVIDEYTRRYAETTGSVVLR